MPIVDVQQGSREWFYARCGKVTASEVKNAVSFLQRGGESAARAKYKAQIVAEILTGEPDMDGFVSEYMKWGTQNEAEARAAYEIETENIVDTIAFIQHPAIARAGASPDGLIGDDGGLEIKCPKTDTHIRYLLTGEVPEEYRPQMYWGMACSGRQWWDFASYDPRLPEPLRLFVKRLPRDEAKISELETAVLQFLAEVDDTIVRLKALVGEFKLPEPEDFNARYPAEEGFLTEEDFYGLIDS